MIRSTRYLAACAFAVAVLAVPAANAFAEVHEEITEDVPGPVSDAPTGGAATEHEDSNPYAGYSCADLVKIVNTLQSNIKDLEGRLTFA